MIYILSLLMLFSCSSSDDDATEKSSEKKITEFKIQEDQNAVISFDEQNKSISIIVDKTVDLLSVTPVISVSDRATVNPKSGAVQNFANDRVISYTVYAEDGSNQVYKVKVSHTRSSEKKIDSFSFPEMYREAEITGNDIRVTVPFGTDVSKLLTKGELSLGATSVPELGKVTDFSKPVVFTVTAEDNSTAEYTLTLTVEPQETAVRAVWIPDPAHTTAMRTYQNIINTVNLLDELNFNTIYVATWVRAQTAFNSQVLLDNSTHGTKAEGNVFIQYMSGYNTPLVSPTSDPLKDLITEAHKKNIKVIFWFEYGFMANGGGSVPSITNNKIMAKHPDWIGKGNDGNISNYNSSDYYFNGYNPEVQEFLLKLIEESIDLYPEVDGIQGDDRMPAMPRNSGYDDYTVNKYKSEHGGATPPQDINNADWVKWRIDILNKFGKTLHARVKAKKSTALMCFSPNPYPWCEQNLMQQWTTWIQDGIVDILSVQCYRNTAESYRSTVEQAKQYVSDKTSDNLLNPGIILKNGSIIMDEQLLLEQLNINRKLKTNGEAYFYIDGLNDTNVKKVLKAYYPGKAKFPN